MIRETQPVALLCEALAVEPDAVVSMEAMLPASRNPVWRGCVRGHAGRLFLKMQGGPFPTASVREEAEVLSALQGQLPCLPVVITAGQFAASGLPFLVTQALPGRPLSESVATPGQLRCVFTQTLAWLRDLQGQATLRSMLAGRTAKYVGRYLPTFTPIESALAVCRKYRDLLPDGPIREYERLLEGVGQRRPTMAGTEILHGSLAPANVLHDGLLTGVLDFEGTRLGSAMFDVATMAVDLLDLHGLEIARLWFEVCAEEFGEVRIHSEGRPFLIDLLLTRRLAILDGESTQHEKTLALKSLPRICELP